jgi:hypothetical protein
MCLHSLLHSLESLFVQMARDVSAFGVGALRFNRAACAVADLRLVDPAFIADLLKDQPFSGRALISILRRIVGKCCSIEKYLFLAAGVE